MRNEYGEVLDSNGYAASLISESTCFICGNNTIARHEIFHGPYRQKSKAYGLWMNVCPDCHRRIHDNADLDRAFKKIAQNKAMAQYNWDKERFIKEFGKNYLEE